MRIQGRLLPRATRPTCTRQRVPLKKGGHETRWRVTLGRRATCPRHVEDTFGTRCDTFTFKGPSAHDLVAEGLQWDDLAARTFFAPLDDLPLRRAQAARRGSAGLRLHEPANEEMVWLCGRAPGNHGRPWRDHFPGLVGRNRARRTRAGVGWSCTPPLPPTPSRAGAEVFLDSGGGARDEPYADGNAVSTSGLVRLPDE
jgi:hypothetical protein